MSNYLRPKVEAACIFFTVTLAERGTSLLVDHIAPLRDAVRATKSERPFDIDAWVVLPDHLHCIWTLPAGDRDFSTRWRLIKSRFSMALPMGHRRASHIARGERGIWQRRFWEHSLRDADDFVQHVAYCHWNPVKHGYDARAEDWPYSTVHRAIRNGRWVA